MSSITTTCQSCGSPNFSSVFFAGWLPPVNTFQPIGSRPLMEARHPAELLRCKDCGLVQMDYVVHPDLVFPPSYSYRSGTTKLLRDNFAQLTEEVEVVRGSPLGESDLVLDIGSNDGTLLKAFRDRYKCKVLGVEPTGAVEDAWNDSVPTIHGFWDDSIAERIVNGDALYSGGGNAKVVTACNVFAHVPGPHGFLKAVDRALAPGGLLVLEVHYLPELLRTLQYDTVYHEHLRFYDLRSLGNLLAFNGFVFTAARRIPTHGGSLRVYAMRIADSPHIGPGGDIPGLVEGEEPLHRDWENAWRTFRSQVAWSKASLWRMLEVMKRSDSKIYGIGCPSRAVTLIDYCGLDHNVLDCVCEVPDSPKVGHYVPGTRIPVVNEKCLFTDQPDFALLLSWHLADELATKLRLKGYKGRFLCPLPEPRILEV